MQNANSYMTVLEDSCSSSQGMGRDSLTLKRSRLLISFWVLGEVCNEYVVAEERGSLLLIRLDL